MCSNVSVCFFCFNDTATTEIYTLSLHDALPICSMRDRGMGLIYISHRMEEVWELADRVTVFRDGHLIGTRDMRRSEEHTSELQSRQYLVCRLLLEKKKKKAHSYSYNYSRSINVS